MKYTVIINQPKILEFGININQGAILDLLCVAPLWADIEIIDGEAYYWVARQKIAKELEAFDLKHDTIYRHLKKLAEKGLIIYKKAGKKDCIKITNLGKTYYVGNKSEKHTNSEINPKKLGNKSEKNSEINPTYNNTNIINNTNNKKNTKKENLKHLLTEAFKANKILSLKEKINISKVNKDLKDNLYSFKDISIQELVKAYTEYVKENREYSKRLNLFLIGLIADKNKEFTKYLPKKMSINNKVSISKIPKDIVSKLRAKNFMDAEIEDYITLYNLKSNGTYLNNEQENYYIELDKKAR